MTQAQRESLQERLVTALIASVATAIVPVVFAVVTGLVSAPGRLRAIETALTIRNHDDSTRARGDSLQTAALMRMDGNIQLLTLMRCMDREGNPELYARLNCAALPLPARFRKP